eukprot:scaffold24597_cov62-Cyclotella_meneghiniana.AAC.4
MFHRSGLHGMAVYEIWCQIDGYEVPKGFQRLCQRPSPDDWRSANYCICISAVLWTADSVAQIPS